MKGRTLGLERARLQGELTKADSTPITVTKDSRHGAYRTYTLLQASDGISIPVAEDKHLETLYRLKRLSVIRTSVKTRRICRLHNDIDRNPFGNGFSGLCYCMLLP